jgi:hypothetical protein
VRRDGGAPSNRVSRTDIPSWVLAWPGRAPGRGSRLLPAVTESVLPTGRGAVRMSWPAFVQRQAATRNFAFSDGGTPTTRDVTEPLPGPPDLDLSSTVVFSGRASRRCRSCAGSPSMTRIAMLGGWGALMASTLMGSSRRTVSAQTHELRRTLNGYGMRWGRRQGSGNTGALKGAAQRNSVSGAAPPGADRCLLINRG